MLCGPVRQTHTSDGGMCVCVCPSSSSTLAFTVLELVRLLREHSEVVSYPKVTHRNSLRHELFDSPSILLHQRFLDVSSELFIQKDQLQYLNIRMIHV